MSSLMLIILLSAFSFPMLALIPVVDQLRHRIPGPEAPPRSWPVYPQQLIRHITREDQRHD